MIHKAFCSIPELGFPMTVGRQQMPQLPSVGLVTSFTHTYFHPGFVIQVRPQHPIPLDREMKPKVTKLPQAKAKVETRDRGALWLRVEKVAQYITTPHASARPRPPDLETKPRTTKPWPWAAQTIYSFMFSPSLLIPVINTMIVIVIILKIIITLIITTLHITIVITTFLMVAMIITFWRPTQTPGNTVCPLLRRRGFRRARSRRARLEELPQLPGLQHALELLQGELILPGLTAGCESSTSVWDPQTGGFPLPDLDRHQNGSTIDNNPRRHAERSHGFGPSDLWEVLRNPPEV